MQTLTVPEWFAERLLRRLGKASCPAPASKKGADRCGSTWPAESGSRKGYPATPAARLQPTIHPWSKPHHAELATTPTAPEHPACDRPPASAPANNKLHHPLSPLGFRGARAA